MFTTKSVPAADSPGTLEGASPERTMVTVDPCALLLVLAWVGVVWFVDPRGEFPINDDWSFRLTLERLLNEGRLGTTGWGPDAARSGGPALITHLLWATLFVKAFGLSFLTLRASVLCLGLFGALSVYTLLRRNDDRALALWGALAVAANPLYLSQSFTFMSDVSFTALLCIALLAIVEGIERNKSSLFLLGQVASLAAVLTRQLGLALPAAVLVLGIAHPTVRAFGVRRIVVSTVFVVLLPWVAFEVGLWKFGSTPVTQHLVTHRLLERVSRTPLRALKDVLGVFFHHGLLYLSVLLAPVTLLLAPGPFTSRTMRRVLLALTALCAATTIASALGFVRVPVLLHRNILSAWGIGPVLLKDVATLHMSRLEEVPRAFWCCCLYVAATSTILLVADFRSTLRQLMQRRLRASVASALSAVACGLYMAVITLSDYQDRYLIPACALLVIALLADRPALPSWPTRLPAMLTLVAMGMLSVLGTRDFMELKRAQLDAHIYLHDELGVPTCETDSGFEWNGYHCYRPNFEPVTGYSKWWVNDERYVLALDELPGLHVLRTYPFRRLLGDDGAVHVLMR